MECKVVRHQAHSRFRKSLSQVISHNQCHYRDRYRAAEAVAMQRNEFTGRTPKNPAKRLSRALVVVQKYADTYGQSTEKDLAEHFQTEWYVLKEHAHVPLEELRRNEDYRKSYDLMVAAGWVRCFGLIVVEVHSL